MTLLSADTTAYRLYQSSKLLFDFEIFDFCVYGSFPGGSTIAQIPKDDPRPTVVHALSRHRLKFQNGLSDRGLGWSQQPAPLCLHAGVRDSFTFAAVRHVNGLNLEKV